MRTSAGWGRRGDRSPDVAAAVTGGRSQNPAAEDSGSYNAGQLRKNANLIGSTVLA